MGSPPVRVDDDVQRKQAQAASQQRQLEIKRDTDKMAELTQELNEFLGKNQASLMSVDAIKKAEQIEKLAHNVKSKMKQVATDLRPARIFARCGSLVCPHAAKRKTPSGLTGWRSCFSCSITPRLA